MAALSLVTEARLTPKPGLVDQRNTGAHTDMDLSTFMTSATALEPLFAEYLQAGWDQGAGDAAELADTLRRIGIRAEGAMFAATDGINTHKGANFMFALVLGAAGAVLRDRGDSSCTFDASDTARTLELVSAMGESLLGRDVRALLSSVHTGGAQLTHGEAVAHGLVAALWLSVRKRGFDAGLYGRVREFVRRTYPRYEAAAEGDALYALMLHDKKNERAGVNFTLLRAPGEPEINCYCEREEILEALKEIG